MTSPIVSFLALVWLMFLNYSHMRANRAQRREHARREDLLLNQLLHATGKTWQPPPSEPPAAVITDLGAVPVTWTATPERFPT